MHVHHDAAGLVFFIEAVGRQISFTLCRRAEKVTEAYIRRGNSKEEFSYLPLAALVDEGAFNHSTNFIKGAWEGADWASTMEEAANWLSVVRGIEELPFYQEHFKHRVTRK